MLDVDHRNLARRIIDHKKWLKNDSASGLFLNKARVSNYVFANVKLTLAEFVDAEFKNVTFVNCKLNAVDFRSCRLTNVRFENCNMNYVNMSDVEFSGDVAFINTKLKNARFTGTTDIVKARLVNVTLIGAMFYNNNTTLYEFNNMTNEKSQRKVIYCLEQDKISWPQYSDGKFISFDSFKKEYEITISESYLEDSKDIPVIINAIEGIRKAYKK